jgi:hypothetical protein
MSIYKEIIFPTEENHTIELPKNMFGKEVEVIFKVIDLSKDLPKLKKQKLENIFEQFGKGKDFPSVNELRLQNWSRKW